MINCGVSSPGDQNRQLITTGGPARRPAELDCRP